MNRVKWGWGKTIIWKYFQDLSADWEDFCGHWSSWVIRIVLSMRTVDSGGLVLILHSIALIECCQWHLTKHCKFIQTSRASQAAVNYEQTRVFLETVKLKANFSFQGDGGDEENLVSNASFNLSIIHHSWRLLIFSKNENKMHYFQL